MFERTSDRRSAITCVPSLRVTAAGITRTRMREAAAAQTLAWSAWLPRLVRSARMLRLWGGPAVVVRVKTGVPCRWKRIVRQRLPRLLQTIVCLTQRVSLTGATAATGSGAARQTLALGKTRVRARLILVRCAFLLLTRSGLWRGVP